jgi:hypothetical protein
MGDGVLVHPCRTRGKDANCGPLRIRMHDPRCKRKSRTSVLPPIPDIIAASHRLASYGRGKSMRRSDEIDAWLAALPVRALKGDDVEAVT